MKNILFALFALSVSSVFISCQNSHQNNNLNNCGVEMKESDMLYYINKTKNIENAYESGGMKLYDVINDSIRNVLPDSLTFEIFLSFSNEDEIAITIHGPSDQTFIQQVRCTFFNSNFNADIPKKKYLIVYSYSNPDGSGESSFETALKSNNLIQ